MYIHNITRVIHSTVTVVSEFPGPTRREVRGPLGTSPCASWRIHAMPRIGGTSAGFQRGFLHKYSEKYIFIQGLEQKPSPKYIVGHIVNNRNHLPNIVNNGIECSCVYHQGQMTSPLKLVDGPNVNQTVFNRPVYNGIIIAINHHKLL